MYDRIVTGKFKSEEMDEASKIMKESIIPAQKARNGWKGTKILVDREKSILTTINMLKPVFENVFCHGLDLRCELLNHECV